MERVEAGGARGEGRGIGSRAQARSFICCGPALPWTGVSYSRAARRPAGEQRPAVRAGGETAAQPPAVSARGTPHPGNAKRPPREDTPRVPPLPAPQSVRVLPREQRAPEPRRRVLLLLRSLPSLGARASPPQPRGGSVEEGVLCRAGGPRGVACGPFPRRRHTPVAWHRVRAPTPPRRPGSRHEPTPNLRETPCGSGPAREACGPAAGAGGCGCRRFAPRRRGARLQGPLRRPPPLIPPPLAPKNNILVCLLGARRDRDRLFIPAISMRPRSGPRPGPRPAPLHRPRGGRP